MWVKRTVVATTLAVVGLGIIPGVATADPAAPTSPDSPAPIAPGPPPPDPSSPPPGAPTPDPSAPTAPGPPAPVAPTTPGATPPPAAKTTIDADGTFNVGTDIVPGVYSSPGPVAGGVCSWRRTGNPDGATLDNALTHLPQVVQIDPTDKAFKTTGCQTWQLTDGAVPDSATTISPFIAGLQLRSYMNQLNSRAAAAGQAGELPPP